MEAMGGAGAGRERDARHENRQRDRGARETHRWRGASRPDAPARRAASRADSDAETDPSAPGGVASHARGGRERGCRRRRAERGRTREQDQRAAIRRRRVAEQSRDRAIARHLAQRRESSASAPDRGMKPEHDLRDETDEARQRIAPAHVRELVQQHVLDLAARPIEQRSRQHDAWREKADHCWQVPRLARRRDEDRWQRSSARGDARSRRLWCRGHPAPLPPASPHPRRHAARTRR